VASTTEYVERVEAGRSIVAGRRDLTPREQIEEALFMGLRLNAGISLAALRERYGVDVWRTWGGRLEPYLEAGLLQHDGERLRLTREGMLVSNDVMSAFIDGGSTVK
jgi:oxygen-independent coproporphyrinogen-3 oxidase